MSEIDAHTLVRLGLIAFILAAGLFIALVPSFLLSALTVPGSISLLLLLWIFIWISTILALAIRRASAVTPAPVLVSQPAVPVAQPVLRKSPAARQRPKKRGRKRPAAKRRRR